MKSSLPTLARIQKFNIDEQRKLLVEQQELEAKLLNELNQLINRFEEEKLFARSHTNVGDFGLYVKKFMTERESLEIKIQAVGRRITEIRDLIADLFKEQKTYEIVEHNRKDRAEKESAAKEQKMLDEIGTNTYIKHKQS